MKQLPDVQAVNLTAAGQPLFVPGVANPQPRDAWPSVDPSGLDADAAAYVASTIGVRQLVEGGTRPVDGQAGTRDPLLANIAIAESGARIAGIDVEGQTWSGALVPEASLFSLPAVKEPVGLAFDGVDDLWIVDLSGNLTLYSPTGRSFPIEVGGLTSGDVRPRAAIPLVTEREQPYSWNPVREPICFWLESSELTHLPCRHRGSRAHPRGVELVEVVDVASSADSLAVLGSEVGTLQVIDVSIGRGSLFTQGAPEGPVSLAAAPGLPTLVAAADGVIHDNTSGTWSGRVTASSPASGLNGLNALQRVSVIVATATTFISVGKGALARCLLL